MPDCASKVPEIDGGVIRDDEGLAIHLPFSLVLLLLRAALLDPAEKVHQLRGRLEVGLRDVTYVRHIEEIIVGTDLEFCTPCTDDVEEVGNELDIAFAEDGGGPEGGGEEWLEVL